MEKRGKVLLEPVASFVFCIFVRIDTKTIAAGQFRTPKKWTGEHPNKDYSHFVLMSAGFLDSSVFTRINKKATAVDLELF